MTDPESQIIHREFRTDVENPAVQIIEAITELEERDSNDLPPLYNCVDGVLDHLFSNPPVSEAQMQVQFSYAGYRITIEQDGSVKFVKTN